MLSLMKSIALAVAIVLVLAALHVRDLVERWDGDVAHLRQVVREKTEGVEWDFNHELARAYDWFRRDDGRELGVAFADKVETWQVKAPAPRLFRAWYLVDDDGRGGPVLRRFDAEAHRFVATAWTDELAAIRAAVIAHRLGPELDRPAALLVPLAARAGDGPIARYALGVLDLDYVTRIFLPRLARDNLGDERVLFYDVGVRRADDPASVLVAAPRPHPEPDVEVPLFRIGFVHLDDVFLDNDLDGECKGLWRLRVTHRDGSIAAHVDRARRRDLILAAAVVALLLASLGLLLISARRAQRLAAQQLAFVAGVTHELRTPLTVIRSAAENLADGVVHEPAHVRRYGALLLGEGRRLSRMVEQAIDVAALETGARPVTTTDYDVAALIAELAAEPNVTTTIAPSLPTLRGDPAAVRTVLGNLIENARK